MSQENFSGRRYFFDGDFSLRTDPRAYSGVPDGFVSIFPCKFMKHRAGFWNQAENLTESGVSVIFVIWGYQWVYESVYGYFRCRQIFNFSQDFQQNTFPARLEPFQSCSRSIFYSLWHHGDVQNSKILSTLTMYRLSFFVLSWGILHWNLWDFDPNRIWTHRDQFSTDSGVRGLYFRGRHCIRPLLRVMESRGSKNPVWVDQVEWEDSARTHLWVITRRTL